MPTSDRPDGPANGPKGPNKPRPLGGGPSADWHPGWLLRHPDCFLRHPDCIADRFAGGDPASPGASSGRGPGVRGVAGAPFFPSASRFSDDFTTPRHRPPPAPSRRSRRRPLPRSIDPVEARSSPLSKQFDTGGSFRVTHFATPTHAFRRLTLGPTSDLGKVSDSGNVISHPGSVSKRASSPSPYGRSDRCWVEFDLFPSSNRSSGTSA